MMALNDDKIAIQPTIQLHFYLYIYALQLLLVTCVIFVYILPQMNNIDVV